MMIEEMIKVIEDWRIHLPLRLREEANKFVDEAINTALKIEEKRGCLDEQNQ